MRALLLISACVLSACASTRQSNAVRHSGFLSDYARLEQDELGGSSWTDVELCIGDYADCYLPPVELRLAAEELDGADEDVAGLAEYFRTAAADAFTERGWEVVDHPGERTLTIRLALTELGGANPFGNILTGLPRIRIPVRLVAVLFDVHVFVGAASTEIQVVDSHTGAVLAEALDRRVGAQAWRNMGSTWGDVHDAMEVWAERLAEALSR